MTWKDRLQDASFRGVPFKVEEESAGTGRRVETHEYPNRDKPYTEDLGKITFRPSITAYVVGDDCFDQRDRLIEALNKPGPGTLVHPTYGELKVCVDGEVRVSTSKSEGRIVRFDLKFVEAGELSYPTSGAATAQTLMSSCSALDDCISDSFSGFSIDGVADFVQNDVIGNASIMLGYVSDAMKVVDSAVSDAAPSLSRVHQRADALMRELDPRTTTELINRWERLCGLPDECIPAGTQTLRQRQQRLDAKVNLAGGINEDFYLAQLAALGRPDATITRYDKSTFTCSSACTDAVNAPEWRYYWQVNMPAATNTTWMTCGDPCDSALRIWGDTVVECVLNKLCPSHTYVIFKYPE
ncbi:DNA circularization N-terminal domain-containing protein [Enterococcus faecalis]|nr:DNA circularization N-terminal domain-containing protein [Enterococcus faecalis]